MSGHVSVLLAESVASLGVRPGGVYADVTCGLGGHSEAILEASSPDGRLLSIDRDPSALEQSKARLERFGSRVVLREASFSELPRVGADFTPFDGILADLGVSSIQLDDGARGFSFRFKGPLDMRMGPGVGETLGELLDRVDERELARILRRYGEVKRPKVVAESILEARAAGRLEDTRDLARIVEERGGRGRPGHHPATLVFQALRIAVNRELEELDALMTAAHAVLGEGGRLAVISFHSLEDRLVKRAFAGPKPEPGLRYLPAPERNHGWRALGRGVEPTDAEARGNPRARSARLRTAEKVGA